MTHKLPHESRPHRNAKASGDFDGTGIKYEGQFELRFPYILSQTILKLAPFRTDPKQDMPLATRDARFDRIDGLAVIKW